VYKLENVFSKYWEAIILILISQILIQVDIYGIDLPLEIEIDELNAIKYI
jgi:hypothetical protein